MEELEESGWEYITFPNGSAVYIEVDEYGNLPPADVIVYAIRMAFLDDQGEEDG